MRLHSRSSSSLRSFWENSSNVQTSTDLDSSEDSDDTEDEDTIPLTLSAGKFEASMSRSQVNLHRIGRSVPPSRRNSSHHPTDVIKPFQQETRDPPTPALAPTAFMLAWRDQLLAQLHQFNESAQSVMPNLNNLNVPLAALQDYQANPMVRRVSALWPQRPNSRQQNNGREGWWETLTGSSSPPPSSQPSSPPPPSSPPAYRDLYPDEKGNQGDWSVKQRSEIQAAADAAADLHFNNETRTAGSSSQVKPASVLDKPIERIELSRDRKLFFFWVREIAFA